MSYRYPSLKRQRSEEQLNQTTPSSRNISVSMFESLQGSTDKLSSTLETLTKSVNILKALQPDVQRIRTITQTERKYEILTEKEIEEASHTISNETIPKIDMLLKKAQDIIDDMGDTSRDIEKKVDEQDFILGKQASKDQKGTIPSHLSDMDLEKLTALRMRTRKHQVKQEYLSREINECDASIQKLVMGYS
ncbi:hypothetical protein BJ944DRAFT_130935 [Cunninghamella echinulata]|nr:hypothetical protein BJ944DRAFT_130935 [Cunninghamella echinulata]